MHVVDSRLVGMGLGFAVLAGVRARDAGGGAEQVAAAVRACAAATSVFFYVDTLEHLRRGGRIGSGQALLGSVLSVKPILHLDAGHILPLEKVRTAARAVARLEEIAFARATSAGVGEGGDRSAAPRGRRPCDRRSRAACGPACPACATFRSVRSARSSARMSARGCSRSSSPRPDPLARILRRPAPRGSTSRAGASTSCAGDTLPASCTPQEVCLRRWKSVATGPSGGCPHLAAGCALSTAGPCARPAATWRS